MDVDLLVSSFCFFRDPDDEVFVEDDDDVRNAILNCDLCPFQLSVPFNKEFLEHSINLFRRSALKSNCEISPLTTPMASMSTWTT